MDDAGPCFDGGMTAFYLFRNADWTAGLAAFVGTDPVIAQHRMQGFPATSDIKEHRFVFTLKVDIQLISV